MDPEYGLPSLPDKSFDLGFADPPWNIKFNFNKSALGVFYFAFFCSQKML